MELQIIRTRHPPKVYVGQIAQLNTEAGHPAKTREIHRRLEGLPKEDRLLLAIDADRLIGYAHLKVNRDLLNDETAEVVAIVVRKTHRRMGVGRRLVTAAETWAEQSGKARLLLHTDVVRAEAHAFFLALGYEEHGTSVEFVRDLQVIRNSEATTRPPSPPQEPTLTRS